MPKALLETLLDLYPDTNLWQGYGMTEAGSVVSILGPEEHRKGDTYLRSAGAPLTGVELSIQDPFGRTLPTGETGEVCVRGANVMVEYWRQPEATAVALRGGWYHTTGPIASAPSTELVGAAISQIARAKGKGKVEWAKEVAGGCGAAIRQRLTDLFSGRCRKVEHSGVWTRLNRFECPPAHFVPTYTLPATEEQDHIVPLGATRLHVIRGIPAQSLPVHVSAKMPPVRFRFTTPDLALSHLHNLFIDSKTQLRSVFRFRLISTRAIIWSRGSLPPMPSA
jgi:hypothetical protein